MVSMPATLQLLFAWMAGILAMEACRTAGGIVWMAAAAFAVAAVICATVGAVGASSARFGRRRSALPWQGAAAWMAVAALGVAKAAVDVPMAQPVNEAGTFVVEVSSDGSRRARTVAHSVMEHPSGWRFMLYWGGDTPLEPGDVVEVVGRKFALADTVAYHRYLARQGFSGTMYARTARVRPDISPSWMNRWRLTTRAVRQWCLRQVDKHLPAPPVRALLQGCLFGDRRGFDAEVREDFSYAGMGHLLAVSGLHVGILFALLGGLLFPLRFVVGRATVRVVSLLFVWAYVALIGFPVSAVRAAVMFSVVYAAGIMGRNALGVATLCFAAWLLLVYDTQLLWSVSFQMSFLAVAAIMAIRPELYALGHWQHFHGVSQAASPWRRRWATWRRAVAAYVVSALLVSGAASMATLPLALHYFHHLPMLGCLQALVVLPLLAPYLVAVVLLLVFHSAAAVLPAGAAAGAGVAAAACWWVVAAISQWILAVARWAHDGDVWMMGDVSWFPDACEVVGMYVTLLSLFLLWRMRHGGWLIAALSAVAFMIAYGLVTTP